jgi:hypothetical protein
VIVNQTTTVEGVIGVVLRDGAVGGVQLALVALRKRYSQGASRLGSGAVMKGLQ